MSALSNGSMKKGEKRENFSEIGSVIYSGRGYEAQVTAKTLTQEYVQQPAAMSLSENAPSMEELDQFIDSSSIPEEAKKETKATLHQGLLVELNKGEQASVATVKEQLVMITDSLPTIREKLRCFIENHEGISKTVRFVTHKMLLD
ncbi:MAG: hypothetical protein H6658_16300 [Ardenticatenaceae bacterium]|nr:hypothetical protein [Ardenticatenaceae bacterium]